jgi:hypothetical protein
MRTVSQPSQADNNTPRTTDSDDDSEFYDSDDDSDVEGDDATDEDNITDGEGGGSGHANGPVDAEDDRADNTTNETRANRPKARKADNRRRVLGTHFHPFLRPNLHSTDIAPEDFKIFENHFNKQLKYKFQELRDKPTSPSVAPVRTRRSVTSPTQFLDDAATRRAEGVNIKRLSRLHVEDVIKTGEGDTLYLFFRYVPDVLNMHEFNGKILHIAEKQREARIGGEVVKISTDKYVCLRATVTNDTLHHDILSGGIS